jgi:hypothetical protein
MPKPVSGENAMLILTRRAFLQFAAIVPFFAPVFLRSTTSMTDEEELVIVNGWFLRKSDLSDRQR